ncbi:hypothetical protein BDZ91DRAFT_461106 [Kalaharituber pfeilii]|nr:hypothetical protein BDZ91DRAFT_461106 [Kalaharituber pfeilii]
MEDLTKGQQQSHNRANEAAVQVLHTKLVIAEDSLQTKQVLITELQDHIKDLEQQLQQQKEYEQKVQGEKQQLELNLATIKAEHEKCCNLMPTHIAIKSVKLSEKYIQMRNDRVQGATSIGTLETFELIRHPNGMVSFKSTCFPNLYLSVEASKFLPGLQNGGGSVKCSNTCGSREMFWIDWADNAEVGIEPADFKARFLMMNGNGVLQGYKGSLELFYIVVVK